MRNLIGMFVFIVAAFFAGAVLWCMTLAMFFGKEKLFSGTRNAVLTYLGSSFAGWGFAAFGIWTVIQLQNFLY